MLIIGIDPGITGAVARLNVGGPLRITVHDTPFETAKGKKNKKTGKYNIKKIYLPSAMSALLSWLQKSDSDIHAYIEKVASMPGQGVVSMFNFGMGYGIWIGILAALKIPYTMVTPQAWKKVLMQGIKDKDAARGRACQLFPMMANELNYKKDIGRADSLLIAEYGRRTFRGNDA